MKMPRHERSAGESMFGSVDPLQEYRNVLENLDATAYFRVGNYFRYESRDTMNEPAESKMLIHSNFVTVRHLPSLRREPTIYRLATIIAESRSL